MSYCACGCGRETTISDVNNTARGWVKGEPRRYIRGHSGGIREVPLFDHVDVRGPDECWPWTGLFDSHGYGKVRRGRAPRLILAEKIGRDLLPGEVARHTCDNRPCCNPAHLTPGSHADNSRDAIERGRQVRGERHGQSKLTWAQVESIRSLFATGEVRQADLAIRFGVARSTIGTVVARRGWVA